MVVTGAIITRIHTNFNKCLASSEIPREHIWEEKLKSYEDTNCNLYQEPEDLHSFEGISIHF